MPDTRTERMECIAECVEQDGLYTWANSIREITAERDKLKALLADAYRALSTPPTSMPDPRPSRSHTEGESGVALSALPPFYDCYTPGCTLCAGMGCGDCFVAVVPVEVEAHPPPSPMIEHIKLTSTIDLEPCGGKDLEPCDSQPPSLLRPIDHTGPLTEAQRRTLWEGDYTNTADDHRTGGHR